MYKIHRYKINLKNSLTLKPFTHFSSLDFSAGGIKKNLEISEASKDETGSSERYSNVVFN